MTSPGPEGSWTLRPCVRDCAGKLPLGILPFRKGQNNNPKWDLSIPLSPCPAPGNGKPARHRLLGGMQAGAERGDTRATCLRRDDPTRSAEHVAGRSPMG